MPKKEKFIRIQRIYFDKKMEAKQKKRRVEQRLCLVVFCADILYFCALGCGSQSVENVLEKRTTAETTRNVWQKHHLRRNPTVIKVIISFHSFIRTKNDGFCIFILNLKARVNNVCRSCLLSRFTSNSCPPFHPFPRNSHDNIFPFYYFLFFFLILIFLYINNTNIYGEKMFTKKNLIFMTLGIFSCGIFFFFFRKEIKMFLSRQSVSKSE